jgi:hypothetical protein
LKNKKPTSGIARFAAAQFTDQAWRLNNLYYIVDKSSRRVRFQFNWAQQELYNNLHTQNIILKARQLGMSTFVSLYMLDRCIFKKDVRAGSVAHDMASARGLFRDKIKFPFENLPEQLRNVRAPLNDSSEELLLNNNSALRIATSMRSGTLNMLHISELGKIAARFPDRAREVISGSLNTLDKDAMLFIESTAEGEDGKFYELCQAALTRQRMGARLSSMEQRFHFFPWMCDSHYIARPDFDIPAGFADYFAKLRTVHGIELSLAQKAWYVSKAETQFEDMKREFPSTPDEAFSVSIEGTYFAQQIVRAEMDGRIGSFRPDPRYAVNTAWDIGIGDATAIWFYQYLGDSGRLRFLYYYEMSGEGAEHYARKIRQLATEHRWPAYGYHFLLQDVAVREWGTNKTRVEQLIELGIRPSRVPRHEVDDGINAVRMNFGHFEFDEHGCSDGLKALRAYRKEWDEERGRWKDKPRRDWASHGADALRYCAMAWHERMKTTLDDVIPPAEDKRLAVLCPSDPATQRGVTLDELFEYSEGAERPGSRQRI